MFSELDQALEQILNDPQAPGLLPNADIKFVTPMKGYSVSNVTVNLFLLEVKENRVLRDPLPIYDFIAGVFTRKQPPMRVDVSYVVTAWSSSVTGQIQEEHDLLAQALGWLNCYPTIPQALLPNQPFPVMMFTAVPDERLNLSEFWNALGIPPRAAFTLTATVALDLAPVAPVGPPVESKEMVYKKLLAPETLGPTIDEGIEIGGVVTHNGIGVQGVTIQIASLGLTTTSDAQGRFRLSILKSGTYSLQATKGNSSASKPVAVPPAALNEYDIQL